MSFGIINGKLNINQGVNSSYSNISPIKSYLLYSQDKDSFALSGNTTSADRAAQATVPIFNLFPPKQLLIAYSKPDMVRNLISKNPNIKELFDSQGYSVGIYPSNISNICNSHIDTTTFFAKKIADEMKLSQAEKKQLEQACVFHDYGKILIPSELINKPCSLTQNEKSIVDLHAQLGYELLADSGMNNRVLELIKNHHNPMSENADVLGQILSVADIYSALREPRSYKDALTEADAFKLLDQKASKGEVSTEVVNALKTALTSQKLA